MQNAGLTGQRVQDFACAERDKLGHAVREQNSETWASRARMLSVAIKTTLSTSANPGTWALEGCALSVAYLVHVERDSFSGQHVGFSAHAERELLSHVERGAPGQNLLKLIVSLICLLSFGDLEYP